MSSQSMTNIFKGLEELGESAFPKTCSSCGKIYATFQEYLDETQSINTSKSGLKQGYDDNDAAIIELYRNCVCGSTLMNFFQDRRDNSEHGNLRRERFEKLLCYLVEQGIPHQTARIECLKVLYGEESQIINQLKQEESQK